MGKQFLVIASSICTGYQNQNAFIEAVQHAWRVIAFAHALKNKR
jgi:hypothetical protein